VAAVGGPRAGEAAILVLAWLVLTPLVRFGRDLPWSLAAIAGLAAAVLVVATVRTGRRLRALREPRWKIDRDGR
jgi:hypothetical protein